MRLRTWTTCSNNAWVDKVQNHIYTPIQERHAALPKALYSVLQLLAQSGTLPQTYRTHKLSGAFSDYWVCHIKPDWLLLWKQNDKELVLLMTNTGTHADIFNK